MWVLATVALMLVESLKEWESLGYRKLIRVTRQVQYRLFAVTVLDKSSSLLLDD